MKSFSESLQITKNMNLAKQCFGLMVKHGIDPEKFVEWYCDFGVIHQEQGVLLESSIKWLETQSLLTEMPTWFNNVGNSLSSGFGAVKNKVAGAIQNNFGPQAMGNYAQKAGNMAAGVQNLVNQTGQTMSNMHDKFHQGLGHPNWWRQAQAAEQALNLLHRRIGVSPNLMQAVGGQQFMQTVLQLMQTLRSMDQTQIAASEDSTIASSSTKQKMPEPLPGDTVPFRVNVKTNESFQIKNEIRAGLKKLQSYGHDPVKFVEWFISEIQKINEGLWDSAGEFLGNTWANTMGSANRWLTGSPQQKWGHDAAIRTKNKDLEAITKAVQSLDAFQKIVGNLNPEFKNTLNNVLNVLQGDAVKQYVSEQPPQSQQSQQSHAVDVNKLSAFAQTKSNPKVQTSLKPGSDPEVGGNPGSSQAVLSPMTSWVDPKSVSDARGNVAHKKRVGETLNNFEKDVDYVEGQSISDEEKHAAVAALLQKYGNANGMNTPTECRKYWLDYFAESNFYKSLLGSSGKSWFN